MIRDEQVPIAPALVFLRGFPHFPGPVYRRLGALVLRVPSRE